MWLVGAAVLFLRLRSGGLGDDFEDEDGNPSTPAAATSLMAVTAAVSVLLPAAILVPFVGT